jgi:hypothetical protein
VAAAKAAAFAASDPVAIHTIAASAKYSFIFADLSENKFDKNPISLLPFN